MHRLHPALVLALLLGSLAAALPRLAWAQPALRPELIGQIRTLAAEKRARTPAEQKVASRLLYAERRARGVPMAPGLERVETDVETDSEGRVLLDVKGEISPGLLRRLEALGGEVVTSLPRRGALRAWLPLRRVVPLAARAEVTRVAPADRAFTRKTDTSEGDGAHYADDARASLGIDGTGVRVGVLSDGVDALASLQASGDLPPGVTVLSGQAGSGSEGTAMLEIVFDLAPGADLLFATAFGGQASFAANIVALRNAGADVIVDDVGYFAEAVFQDDDVAAAVDQVVADGALYFSSAGNSGNLNDGTAGVFEGDFVAGADFGTGGPPGPPGKGLAPAHDYGGGDITNQIALASPFAYTLKWADALGASANDYDLYLVEADGSTVVRFSNDTQNGNDDPFEFVSAAGGDTGRQLIVVKFSGADRFFHLNANRGRLEYATDGQAWGHPGARGAVAVAAVDARPRAGGFLGDESVEPFSSDGPRRVFFEADGSAITPGDFSSGGGELRDKPELAGADCVDTATPGFDIFCGTSAAAPHLAALAALLVEDAGGPGVADPDQVLAALETTAIDIEAAGADRDSGLGIAHVELAGEALCSSGAECDDGVFCNGSETCVSGLCQPGTPPSCQAPTPFCDEGADACVACLADGDCDDGLFCNGAETCAAGACQPGQPADCQAPTPFCDEADDACVECLNDLDCDDGLFCNGVEMCPAGACLAGSAPSCEAPTPFCDETAEACAECLDDGDCDDLLFCTGTETCAAGACQPDPGPVCEPPTPFCDEGQASCVECQVPADCPQPGSSCNQGVCEPPAIPALPGRAGALWGAVLAMALLGLGVALAPRARAR